MRVCVYIYIYDSLFCLYIIYLFTHQNASWRSNGIQGAQEQERPRRMAAAQFCPPPAPSCPAQSADTWHGLTWGKPTVVNPQSSRR